MSDNSKKIESDRQILKDAQEKGGTAVLGAFFKLSGPGWLQSAITLGGGSLSGALFLGVLGGYSLLWIQLLAIIMGVVMLSAISYVTLSTGQRPFQQINQHINPALGWGWLIATALANMIWCMPQFSLCYAALEKNLLKGSIGDSLNEKLMVSACFLVAAGIAVVMNSRQGLAAKVFDYFLKGLIGVIVLCFFGVVVFMTFDADNPLKWGEILAGFIPNLSTWNNPTEEMQLLIANAPSDFQAYWTKAVVDLKQNVMIASAATAVGINMTFLLPYSMLARGWDKPFRGLARFDLSTGMAIPYILVTSCVVIASASQFHNMTPDASLLSNDPTENAKSDVYEKAYAVYSKRIQEEVGEQEFKTLSIKSEDEKYAPALAQKIAELSDVEKQIGLSLVKRDTSQLASSLTPLLGEKNANIIFGIGICGMGFSTIIILMLINGYVFTEMLGAKPGGAMHVTGCLIAGVSGAAWPFLWSGDSQIWLSIIASSFGMMLLPIAYITFALMMNSKKILGENKPTGLSMIIWNVLMIASVIVASIWAGTAFYGKVMTNELPVQIGLITILVVYVILVIAGFVLKKSQPKIADAEAVDAE
ncbi:MAG: hypothetical protein COA78_12180 [Blastopirellula sp.]|nr:MAG: hypothetical protein COA78_12180 [Blastopirellula sp.]